MKKYLLLLLMPILLASATVDSTEIDFILTNQENFLLNAKVTDETFTSIPSNPNVYSPVDTYLDRNLTQKASTLKENQAFHIQSVEINNQNQQVFLLDNGQYLLADLKVIFDDQILESTTTQATVWLKKILSYIPILLETNKNSKTSLKAYQSVEISEIVTTPTDIYAKIDGKGWLKSTDISQEDNRIEAVQELLNKKYVKDNIGVYVKQLTSQKTAGVNQDKMMYAASVTKLPVLYYVQEKIDRRV